MASKSYVCDLPGGTATQTIQITAKATIRTIVLSMQDAAAGKTEVSTLSTSQIGTAQPSSNVIARITHGAVAGPRSNVINCVLPVNPFQSLYIHQTGTGNVGTATLITA